MIRVRDVDLRGKRVLIREDFNVPLKGGEVGDDTRLKAGIPTIRGAHDRGATVIIVSHLGRPREGEFDEAFSLEPVSRALSVLLETDVRFEREWIDGFDPPEHSVTLCENVRFLEGEKTNDDGLARRMAALCEVYVNDAFATAHRTQASTYGIAKFAPVACAGPLLTAELDALGRALKEPARPLVAIVGGAKVSTKLEMLESLLDKVDQLIVGGGIANTFLKAAGYAIGKSLYEPNLIDTAARLIASDVDIPLPVDVVCGKVFDEQTAAIVRDVKAIGDDEMIMDLGPETTRTLCERVGGASTIVWNGPLGVFEFERFASGTRELSHAIARAEAFSIAGGGDTLAAISAFGIADSISYISTGGGAFLEFLEGKTLPAVEILKQRAADA